MDDKNAADPRAEELQLLRQLKRQPCALYHASSIVILGRLLSNGEAMSWPHEDHTVADITQAGVRAIWEDQLSIRLKSHLLGKPVSPETIAEAVRVCEAWLVDLIASGDDPGVERASHRACRVCGCTEHSACVDENKGNCWWVAPDLCSHCEDKASIDAQATPGEDSVVAHGDARSPQQR